MTTSSLFWIIFILYSANSSYALLRDTFVHLYGDAAFSENFLSLTEEGSCGSVPTDFSLSVGAALYSHPIRFKDEESETMASFSSQFTFSVISDPECSLADGIVFLISSTDPKFNLTDGFLGLPDVDHKKNSYVGIEFDCHKNVELGDINGNHIGVDVNSVFSFEATDVPIDLQSGRSITAWIEYDGPLNLLTVWIGNSLLRPSEPVLTTKIDLSRQLKDSMLVGFTASSGRGSSMIVVESWSFQSLTPHSDDEARENFCFNCHFADNLSNPNTVESIDDSVSCDVSFRIGLATLVLLIIVVVVLSVFLLWKLVVCKLEMAATKLYLRKRSFCLSVSVMKALAMVLNNKSIIGEGPLATVYRATLFSLGEVAIKRFSRTKSNPLTAEFVATMCTLSHRNLVRLEGWCYIKSDLVLVYEYLPFNLDDLIHKDCTSALRSWSKRKQIVLGVASALSYLHEGCEQKIVHRNIKACNILLDVGFNAKLGDIGLAGGSDMREAAMRAGTLALAYLAPEYIQCGIMSEKTDVYSFGIIMLEVVTGRRPVERDGSVLVDWVWDLWRRGKLMEAADPRLEQRHEIEVKRMLMVGLSCVQQNDKNRPNIKLASCMLTGEAPLPFPEEVQWAASATVPFECRL